MSGLLLLLVLYLSSESSMSFDESISSHKLNCVHSDMLSWPQVRKKSAQDILPQSMTLGTLDILLLK